MHRNTKMVFVKTHSKRSVLCFLLLTGFFFFQASASLSAKTKPSTTTDTERSKVDEFEFVSKKLFKDKEKQQSKLDEFKFVEGLCKDKLEGELDCIGRNRDAIFIFSKGEQKLIKRLRTPPKKSIEESRKFSPSDIGDTISRWREELLLHMYDKYKDKDKEEFPAEAFQHYLAYLHQYTISFDAWKKGMGLVAKYYMNKGRKDSEVKEYLEEGLRWIRDYFGFFQQGNPDQEPKLFFRDLITPSHSKSPPPLTKQLRQYECHLRFLQISFLYELRKYPRKQDEEQDFKKISTIIEDTFNGKVDTSSYSNLVRDIKRKMEGKAPDKRPLFMDEDEYKTIAIISERMEAKGFTRFVFFKLNPLIKANPECFPILLLLAVVSLFLFYYYHRRQIEGILFQEKELIKLKDMFDADGRVGVPKHVGTKVEVIEKLFGEDWENVRKRSKEQVWKKVGVKPEEIERVFGKDWKVIKGWSKEELWTKLDEKRQEVIKEWFKEELLKEPDEKTKENGQELSKEDLGEKQGVELVCQKLILDGYFLIRDANDKFQPYSLYPLGLIYRLPFLKYLPSWLAHAIFSLVVMTFAVLIFFVLNVASGKVGDAWEAFREDWLIRFLAMAAILAGGLELVRYMARKTIGAIDDLVSMLEPDTYESWKRRSETERKQDSSIHVLEKWLKTLLSPRVHRPLVIVFIILLLILLRHIMMGGILAPVPIMVAFYVFLAITVFWVFPVLWMTGASIWFTNKICSHRDLAINPLSPVKTYGLRKWVSVMGSYAWSVFSLLAFVVIFIVTTPFTEAQVLPTVRYLPFFFFIPFVLYYLVIPHGTLKKLIVDKKKLRMRLLQTQISKAFIRWKEKSEFIDKMDELEKMDKHYEVFKKIDVTKESFWDFQAILTFLKATIIPLALGLYQASDDILRWFSEFWG